MANVALFLAIKDEYNEHIVDALTPFIYEGLMSFYNEALSIAEENKTDKVLIIFQKMMWDIREWTQNKINNETNRIKQMSGTLEYLDDLVQCVIRANILLLTYSNTISNIIAQTFYNTFSTSMLIHSCYIECGKEFHNNPFLFYHEGTPMDIKRNQIAIKRSIELNIIKGVRKILPVGLMYKEFLANTINIVNEGPNVELVGNNLHGAIPIVSGNSQLPITKSENRSDKKPDKTLDNCVMNMIKSEHEKTDREKIKSLMQLEKIVKSAEKPQSMLGGKIRSNDYTPNKKLNESDKAVININLNSTTETEEKSSSKSLTSIRDNKYKVKKRYNNEDSEAIDPNNKNFIEEYGAPTETVLEQRRNGRFGS